MDDTRGGIPDPSRQQALEAAKAHDRPRGAPPMSGPQAGPHIPAQPIPQQGHPIQAGQGPMTYQPQPGQYPQQPQQPQPALQPQPLQPGQGVPMQQFIQQAQQPSPGQQQPQQPRPPEQTVADMQALSEAVQREQARQAAEASVEEQQVEEEGTSAEEQEEFQDWFGSANEGMAQLLDQFNNPKRRKRIEAGLEKMRVEDLITVGEIRQKVTISCNLGVEYRTTTGTETQGILEELGRADGSELYLRERLALMHLTLGLRSVGGQTLPSHLNEESDFDRELFRKKFKRVLRFPDHLLADMRINHWWFDRRVRNIMVAEELGNG